MQPMDVLGSTGHVMVMRVIMSDAPTEVNDDLRDPT